MNEMNLSEKIRRGGIFSLSDDQFTLYVYNELDEIGFKDYILKGISLRHTMDIHRYKLLLKKKYYDLCLAFVRYYGGYKYNCYSTKEIIHLWIETCRNYITDAVVFD
ncbi:MAG: hypothetical protein J6Y02_23735 [Pseudobutyrivibrio sp.]|nr:hypothetical protein [Pseudobutyrivibrio sp.]